MMKKIATFLYYWLPPVLLMSLIFFLSTRQNVKIVDEFTINFIFFKTMHMLEYGLLFFLFFRAFSFSFKKKYRAKTLLLVAIVCAIGYGATDELHQLFVPTRQGTVRDLIIDTIGILICFRYTKINLTRLTKLRLLP